MNDKELIELAAKAAGIEGEYDEKWGGVLMEVFIPSEGEGIEFWNPRVDSGQAFDLAVRLGFDIDRTAQGWVTIHCVERKLSFGSVALGDDPYAATRRAIVRAAAEIGRTL